MQSREQTFAKAIYDQVKTYADGHPRDSDERKKYGSMAHKLPILVRTAGLVQALAFVHSRDKPPHKELLGHLAQIVADANSDTFLRKSREADLPEYIYLTERTMLALKWYKRFAQSVLEVETTEGD
jgi:CRISPR-associated protein Cmr5